VFRVPGGLVFFQKSGDTGPVSPQIALPVKPRMKNQPRVDGFETGGGGREARSRKYTQQYPYQIVSCLEPCGYMGASMAGLDPA
jgi:hypothetical protein